jgi:small subunit ribosomal protein S13
MRLFNLSLPKNSKKKINLFLQELFGINNFSSLLICKQLGFNSRTTIRVLTLRHLSIIKQVILQKFTVVSELERVLQDSIKDLIHVKSYRGFRHRLKLPVRGQRTHTNRQTSRNLNK